MSEQTFKSVAAVARHVNRLGYKAHENTVRNHVERRYLLPREDGLFHARDVDAYAAAHLKPLGPDLRGAALSTRLKAAQARKLEAQARREALKAEREAGRLIPRDQYEQDLATRARVLKANTLRFVERWLEDLVLLVEGSEDKIPEALEFSRQRFEEYFAEYAQKGRLIPEGK